jgi:ADP-heptose:LPS heptosyltransferase
MKRILVVNPFGVGDVILTLRVLEGLKHSSHATLIDFVGNERTSEFLRTHSAIHEVYTFNRDQLRSMRQRNILSWIGEYKLLTDVWRSRKYDILLDLSLGREFAFLGFVAGIPVRAGLDYKKRGAFLTKRVPFTNYDGRSVADWQAQVLTSIGYPGDIPDGKLAFKISPAAQDAAKRFLHENGLIHGKKLVVAPGGGRSWGENAHYKQWDPGRFAEVCRRWIAEEGGKVILMGDESEKDLIREISHEIDSPHAQMLGFALPEVMAVLGESQLFLGNDSGLAHLANAMGVPAAVIFGPVDDKSYAPRGRGVKLAVIQEDVPCRPCYQNFKFPPCTHDRVCLEALTVEKVVTALKKIA